MSMIEIAGVSSFGVFAITSLFAAGLAIRGGIRLARIAHVESWWPMPRLDQGVPTRVAVQRLSMWSGVAGLSAVLSILVPLFVLGLAEPSAPRDPLEEKAFDVYVVHPNGEERKVAAATGLQACQRKAITYIRSHGLFEDQWSYSCCTQGREHPCAERYEYGSASPRLGTAGSMRQHPSGRGPGSRRGAGLKPGGGPCARA